MTRSVFVVLVVLGALDARVLGADTTREVGMAVLPLPDQLRVGAGVVRLKGGVPETVRESANQMVCKLGERC